LGWFFFAVVPSARSLPHAFNPLKVELEAIWAVHRNADLLSGVEEVIFGALAAAVFVTPFSELRAGNESALQALGVPPLIIITINQSASVVLGVQIVVVDADALALTSVPLLVPVAVSDVVRIRDALLPVGTPHIASTALWNGSASVGIAAHVVSGSTLAAALSTPDLVAITVGNCAPLLALRPFPFVSTVDLSAAGCFPAIVPSLDAHTTVAIH